MTAISSAYVHSGALVTVVLPAYNHAKYVVEAMESVRVQTFSQWELIVINDGSTDETWDVLSAYVERCGDPRIRLLTQANAGSHATLNRGMALAQTPYLAILNSDDRYMPDRLQRLVAVAQAAGEEEVFIVTGLRLIDGDGEPVPETHWWNGMYREILQRWHVAKTCFEYGAAHTLLWGNFTVSTSNFFMSRSLWQRLGSFRHRRYVPDWDYALRVAIEQPRSFQFLDGEVLLDYRLHGRNTILSGALRNHVEAAYILRRAQKQLSTRNVALVPHAIDRVKYLDRFLRQEKERIFGVEKHRWEQALQAQQSENASLVQALKSESASLVQALKSEQAENSRLAQEVTVQAATLAALRASTSWQMTQPVRWLGAQARRVKHGGIRRLQGLPSLFARFSARSSQLGQPAGNSLCSLEYAQWMLSEAAQMERLRTTGAAWLAGLSDRPLISIVVVAADMPPSLLDALLQSVQAQIYPHWELCFSDDVSARSVLQEHERRDDRIRVLPCPENGYSIQPDSSANPGPRGDWVVFLGRSGELAPHALLGIVQAFQAHPHVDALYGDEDNMDANGARCLPLFKPDWSPALAWSYNYVGPLLCVRRTALSSAGGLPEGLQGSQVHGLVLRLAATGAKIHHIPSVLYHQQLADKTCVANAEARAAGRWVVSEYLAQRYGNRFDRLEEDGEAFVYRPRFLLDRESIVSIIIPTKDRVDLLGPCIDSILRLSTHRHFEIIVIDNNSVDPETAKYLSALVQRAPQVRVLDAPIEFNWSRLNNLGVEQARGDYLVFLNNDTLVITPDWLERLIEVASLPDVATVGPLLLFEDGTVQHAGVIVGMGGWADHVYRGAQPSGESSPFVANTVARNVLANTGACIAIERKKFDSLGGFDEAFQICGSDVELGLRAHHQGLQNVYWPQVRLHHLESKTRSPFVPECDFVQSRLKYAPFREGGDPFYNINLNRMSLLPVPLYPSWQDQASHV